MMKKLSPRLAEMIRFVLTGGVCFVIEYAALTLLVEGLGWHVLLGTPVAFLISVAVNYLLCVRWVFTGARDGSRRAQLGFLITSLMGFVINWLAMAALTALLGSDRVLLTIAGMTISVYQVNKAAATLIVMIWNYFTKRYVLKG